MIYSILLFVIDFSNNNRIEPVPNRPTEPKAPFPVDEPSVKTKEEVRLIFSLSYTTDIFHIHFQNVFLHKYYLLLRLTVKSGP